MEFCDKYAKGQKVYLVVQGEGVYTPIIEAYDMKNERYTTNTYWYILSNSIVFDTEKELEEYKLKNEIYIYKGCNEYGYSRHSDWGY